MPPQETPQDKRKTRTLEFLLTKPVSEHLFIGLKGGPPHRPFPSRPPPSSIFKSQALTTLFHRTLKRFILRQTVARRGLLSHPITLTMSLLLLSTALIFCLIVCGTVSSFSVPASTKNSLVANNDVRQPQVIIVGKIILDKYGPPEKKIDSVTTIGGGGPQAAWAAAASLAVMEYLRAAEKNDEKDFILSSNFQQQHQQVTFMAPVGMKNWSPEMSEQLSQLLPPTVKVVLIPSDEHITPTINIWHDANENVRWVPIDGSFDSLGADSVWQNRPSAQDILNEIQQFCAGKSDVILHAIIESGAKPTGQGQDALPFFDNDLMSRVSIAGVEPIVFADDTSGMVTNEDSHAVVSLISKMRQSFIAARKQGDGNVGDSLFVVTPDRPCYEGMITHTKHTIKEEDNANSDQFFETIIRDGGNGCFTTNGMKMPAATLRTRDGLPVNPTGAGNAFSAAYVVCRGNGSSPQEAASIATAIGGVVCEYEHLPPWNPVVIQRIFEAAREVHEWKQPLSTL